MPKGRPSGSSQVGPSTSRQGQGTQLSQSQRATQPSQTQNTQAERLAADMGTTELNKKVEELVQYLLIMDQKKVPIKKQDINKNVMKESSKVLPVAMKKASERLSKVFGVQVVELTDKLKGSYILVNKLEGCDVNNCGDMENAKMGLLTIVLSIIFMSGGVVKDSELWAALKKLGINAEYNDETFGDVKKMIAGEFVKQAYLEHTKIPNMDQPVYELSWGQRAKAETSKLKILKFVSLMYNKEPEQWTAQYAEAMRGQTEDVIEV